MAWCFEDETSPYTDAVLDALTEDEAIVPVLWPLEVANVLTLAERHKRIAVAQSSRFLQFLQELPVRLDEQTPYRAFIGILNLARTEKLTAYDAAYLELAIRSNAPLATQDQALRRAAAKLGVTVFKRQQSCLTSRARLGAERPIHPGA
jgi:predicted nucleic acid-binding protein